MSIIYWNRNTRKSARRTFGSDLIPQRKRDRDLTDTAQLGLRGNVKRLHLVYLLTDVLRMIHYEAEQQVRDYCYHPISKDNKS